MGPDQLPTVDNIFSSWKRFVDKNAGKKISDARMRGGVRVISGRLQSWSPTPEACSDLHHWSHVRSAWKPEVPGGTQVVSGHFKRHALKLPLSGPIRVVSDCVSATFFRTTIQATSAYSTCRTPLGIVVKSLFQLVDAVRKLADRLVRSGYKDVSAITRSGCEDGGGDDLASSRVPCLLFGLQVCAFPTGLTY